MSTDQATLDAIRSSAAEFFAQGWRRIIGTQPPTVRRHLDAEDQLADKLLGESAYRTLIEVGCSDGSLLLPAALRYGLAYLGLDLAPGAVAATRKALGGTASNAFTAAVRADIDDLAAVLADLPEQPPRPLLVGFPFNVFGNLPEPRRTVATVAGAGADVLILTYDTGAQARAARIEYYRACGFPGRLTDDATGSHFSFQAFRSSVYHQATLAGWLAEQGYQVTVRRYGAIGLAYHGVAQPGRHAPGRAASHGSARYPAE
jgi:hypothetical protein